MSSFKGYWMVTNRCNLRCSYCVLENAPNQLKAELDLQGKKELVSHMYHKLNIRRLTLSGGEVLLIGKRPPCDFIELLRHIRQFRSSDPSQNLEIELYTNGTYLSDTVADEMKGVVDLVAVTIDSSNQERLTEIGRNNQKFPRYFEQIIEVCSRLSKRGIALKLHSVVGQKTQHSLPNEIRFIIDALESKGVCVSRWKFYQYMSYDMPSCDQLHAISEEEYSHFCERVKEALAGREINLHFKDNDEMNASLFNILSYGNAQYMLPGDSWSTSKRTEDLRCYNSMEELFAKNGIEEGTFRQFHEVVG